LAGDEVYGSPEHQAVRAVVRKFVQTFIWENPAARAFVDSRLSTIGGGADEVMKEVVAKILKI
jgi:alkylation response protein AidB-like acyl-CoA dehydrogenase